MGEVTEFADLLWMHTVITAALTAQVMEVAAWYITRLLFNTERCSLFLPISFSTHGIVQHAYMQDSHPQKGPRPSHMVPMAVQHAAVNHRA